jgi:hypothetical protein
MTPLFYPGVNPFPNEETEDLLTKTRELLNMKPVYEDKPFVVSIENAFVVGLPKKQYFSQLEELSPDKQYYINQTGLKKGNLILTLSIYNLLENNTLKLSAGNYERFRDLGMEMREFSGF